MRARLIARACARVGLVFFLREMVSVSHLVAFGRAWSAFGLSIPKNAVFVDSGAKRGNEERPKAML